MNRMFQKKPDKCSEFLGSLDAFRDGSLPENEHLALENHRLECARCRKALAEEERVAALMAELPEVEVSPDFRDRVLRAWRVRRDSVRDALPVATMKRFSTGLGIMAVILLLLPMAREAFYVSATRLLGALDRLPAEYREGIEITFSLPTWAEVVAYFQVWQGRLFESMGEVGGAIAPWSGWLWAALVVMLAIGVWNVWWMRSRLPAFKRENQ